jgi:LytS/YehU family sensor histidine kinase
MYTVYLILAAALIVLIVWINGWRLRQKAKALTIEVRKATLEIKRQQEVLKEQQVRELELVAIRAQMNPHFLFNVLSSIQMLINKKDVLSANNALGKFGKLMRLILENSEKQSIFLADEIEMLKLYVDLECMLFSFNFHLSIDPELDTENISIPTMIIQPYVENAIKHGLSGLTSNRQLNIGFQMQEHILRCTIHDNGIGRKMSAEMKSKHSKHKSMGIRLAYDRLKIINKQVISNVEVVIKDLVDEQGVACGTLVELSLPAGGE